MEKTLVLATNNQGKLEEIRQLLAGLPLKILTLQDYPALVMPEEDRFTFCGNALKKAEAVARFSGEMALADDSGLEVDALGGRPGVWSARYAGEDGNWEANNHKLLEELKGVPSGERGAAFKCAVALVLPGKGPELLEEGCRGRIAEKPCGSGGFGYDPLFIYEPAGLTFAEMPGEEKTKVSHRGKALRRTRLVIKQLC